MALPHSTNFESSVLKSETRILQAVNVTSPICTDKEQWPLREELHWTSVGGCPISDRVFDPLQTAFTHAQFVAPHKKAHLLLLFQSLFDIIIPLPVLIYYFRSLPPSNSHHFIFILFTKNHRLMSIIRTWNMEDQTLDQSSVISRPKVIRGFLQSLQADARTSPEN